MRYLHLLLIALLAVACGSPEPEPHTDQEATGQPAAAEPAPEAADASTPPGDSTPASPSGSSPAPIGPISSRGRTAAPTTPAAPAAGPSGATVAGAGIAFEIPESWTRQTPSSSMRLAQAEIPGSGGPGLLAVFFFGVGGGGGVEANLERWIAQVEVTEPPRRDTFTTGPFSVTTVDVAGTLLPSGMGTGPLEPEPGSRLIGAVVEGPGGPWFFKATGPDATLAEARDELRAMLEGLRAP